MCYGTCQHEVSSGECGKPFNVTCPDCLDDMVVCPDCGIEFENSECCPCKLAKLTKLKTLIARVSRKLRQLEKQYITENMAHG